MHKEPEHAKNPVATVRRLFGVLRGRVRLLLALFIPLIVATAAGLVWPRILGKSIDVMATGGDNGVEFRALLILLAIGAGAHVLGLAAQILQSVGTIYLSQLSVMDMRRDLFGHVQRLPVSDFDNMTHGEFMSRLTNDVDMVANTLGNGILNFVGTLVTLVATFSYMLWLSWRMTLVACVTLPLTYALGRLIVRISRKLFRERQTVLGELNGLAEEMISGQRVVQAFCREGITEASFNALSENLRRTGFKADALGGVMGPTMNMINNIGFVLITVAGGWLAATGKISVGIIVAFVLYSRHFGRPVNEIANIFNQIQSAIAGAERVFRIMDMPAERDAGTLCPAKETVRGEILFDAVTFAYKPGVPVLEDFSLRIKPGQKVALVGETGSGKTTVINLLTRFYEFTEGRILLDGTDIRDIAKPCLRRSMAVVLQDVHLFTGTVAENISFGVADVSEADIKAAAKLANADLFIERLPEGYNTRINQTDTALSQGQCQLLSIARAALADPAVLILDEATSSVDTRTETNIQQAMVRLMHGRTSIIIAHRLSTIRDADIILVLANKRIVEQGTHAQLLAQNGTYAAMCAGKT